MAAILYRPRCVDWRYIHHITRQDDIFILNRGPGVLAIFYITCVCIKIPIMTEDQTVIILLFVVSSTWARVICNNTAQPSFTEFVSMMCFKAHFEQLSMKWDLVAEFINHANRIHSLITMYVVSGSISCSRKYQYTNDTKMTCTVVLQGVGSFFPSGSWGVVST